jgi:hypothetical protein
MANEMEALGTEMIRKAENIAGQAFESVVLDARGTRGGGVSALIDGDGAKASADDGGEDREPGVGELRKAVEEEDEFSVQWALGEGGETESTERDGDGFGGGHSFTRWMCRRAAGATKGLDVKDEICSG